MRPQRPLPLTCYNLLSLFLLYRTLLLINFLIFKILNFKDHQTNKVEMNSFYVGHCHEPMRTMNSLHSTLHC